MVSGGRKGKKPGSGRGSGSWKKRSSKISERFAGRLVFPEAKEAEVVEEQGGFFCGRRRFFGRGKAPKEDGGSLSLNPERTTRHVKWGESVNPRSSDSFIPKPKGPEMFKNTSHNSFSFGGSDSFIPKPKVPEVFDSRVFGGKGSFGTSSGPQQDNDNGGGYSGQTGGSLNSGKGKEHSFGGNGPRVGVSSGAHGPPSYDKGGFDDGYAYSDPFLDYGNATVSRSAGFRGTDGIRYYSRSNAGESAGFRGADSTSNAGGSSHSAKSSDPRGRHQYEYSDPFLHYANKSTVSRPAGFRGTDSVATDPRGGRGYHYSYSSGNANAGMDDKYTGFLDNNQSQSSKSSDPIGGRGYYAGIDDKSTLFLDNIHSQSANVGGSSARGSYATNVGGSSLYAGSDAYDPSVTEISVNAQVIQATFQRLRIDNAAQLADESLPASLFFAKLSYDTAPKPHRGKTINCDTYQDLLMGNKSFPPLATIVPTAQSEFDNKTIVLAAIAAGFPVSFG